MRRFGLFVFLVCCGASNFGFGQTPAPATDGSGQYLEARSTRSSFAMPGWYSRGRFGSRVGVQYDTGASIGRLYGLGSLQGFLPLAQDESGSLLTFSDTRVLLDDRALIGANLGLGQRFYLPGINRTAGKYFYYDTQNTSNFTFGQVSGGFESLGQYLDFRSNYYIPVGNDRKYTSGYYANRFVGNSLLLGRNAQAAMAGFDMEVGALLFDFGAADIRAYTGIYDFYVPGSQQAWGYKARVQSVVLDSIVLGMSLQTDNVFNTTFNFTSAYYFTRRSARRGRPSRREPIAVADRMAEPVQRIQNMVIVNQKGTDEQVAIDPNTGLPYVFIQVANGGNSDGSFEDPYGTLAEAFADPRFAAGNVVVYDRTTGTHTIGAGSVNLAANTQLLSNAPYQYIQTQQGMMLVPLSGRDPSLASLPTIIGDGSFATVQMGNHTVLSGFNLDGATNQAVSLATVSPATTDTVTITNNRMTNTSVAVFLDDVVGKINVSNNTIVDPVLEGIQIDMQSTSSTQAAITVVGNTVTNAGAGSGIDINILGSAGFPAGADILIANNSISNSNLSGILLRIDNRSIVQANIVGNTSNGSVTDSGLEVIIGTSDDSFGFINVANNTLSNNNDDGMLYTVSNGVGYLNLNGNVAQNNGSTFGYTLVNNDDLRVVGTDATDVQNRNVGVYNPPGTETYVPSFP